MYDCVDLPLSLTDIFPWKPDIYYFYIACNYLNKIKLFCLFIYRTVLYDICLVVSVKKSFLASGSKHQNYIFKTSFKDLKLQV